MLLQNSKFFLITAGTVIWLGISLGCSQTTYKHTLRAQSSNSAQRQPIMLAAYQPWFGSNGHINVGYSSQDRTVLLRQIADAKQLGIYGFVVNWYGQQHQFEDNAYALMQQLASEDPDGFKVAIMYDENESDPANSTDAVLADLNYAYQRYIPRSSHVSSSAYLRYRGQPVIFIFPKNGTTDWNRVRQVLNTWDERPLLIYKDPTEKWSEAFDGFYAWVQPGKSGWRRDGSNWGQEYLENFYSTMTHIYPHKLAVGGAWPGFNDIRASWSRNRHMDPRCGRTLEESLRIFRRYYNSSRPLPFLMIETWNDYEEGTNIEGGSHGCKS
ncbi:MAG: hypothetical protein CXZ00_07290 [Acidobacteria bacterium]|nr:MAG: hypothetical protein CXZ00_07290 [Acidobacteriota bacterium]